MHAGAPTKTIKNNPWTTQSTGTKSNTGWSSWDPFTTRGTKKRDSASESQEIPWHHAFMALLICPGGVGTGVSLELDTECTGRHVEDSRPAAVRWLPCLGRLAAGLTPFLPAREDPIDPERNGEGVS